MSCCQMRLLPTQLTNFLLADCSSRCPPTLFLSAPVTCSSRTCPRRRIAVRPSVRSSTGHDRVVVRSCSGLVLGSGALILIGRSMRRTARRARAQVLVRDLLNAVAPGAGYGGGDMLRRRKSRPASGFVSSQPKSRLIVIRDGRSDLGLVPQHASSPQYINGICSGVIYPPRRGQIWGRGR